MEFVDGVAPVGTLEGGGLLSQFLSSSSHLGTGAARAPQMRWKTKYVKDFMLLVLIEKLAN